MTPEGISFLILGGAVAVLLGVLTFKRKTRDPDGTFDATTVLSFGAAYGLAHVGVLGSPGWSAWEHQPFWVVPGVALGALLLSARRSRRFASLTAVATLLAVVIWPGAQAEWSEPGTRWGGLIALALASYALLESALRLAPRLGRIDGPAIQGIVCLGIGALAYHSGYAKFVLLALVLGGLLLPVSVAIACTKGSRMPQTLALGATAMTLALLLGTWFHTFAEQRAPSTAFVLLGAAPLAAWIGELSAFRGRPRAAPLVRIAAAVGVVGAALLIAAQQAADAGFDG